VTMTDQQRGQQARWDEAQRRHEETRARQWEEDRPRPSLELWQIAALARRAQTDPTAMLEWATRVDPQTYRLAVAAQRWDERHPSYSCVQCHDGKDLPENYECQACGADSPLTRH
jgi:hypothetical protein